MKKFANFIVLILLVLIISLPALAQENQEGSEPEKEKAEKIEDKDVTLDRVVVKGENLSEKDSSYTINAIDSEEIQKLGLSNTADIMKRVPGVEVSDYNQGGVSNAVIMRGFATGIHGGDLGIYLDGIPLNEYYGHGGGYADPNVLIPLELSRVLVYKGPSSALYGNFSRGGTVAFFTKKKGDYVDVFQKYGSFNTTDTQAALGTELAKGLWNNTAVQYFRTDGYADNSEHIYGNASTRFTYEPVDKLEISLSLRAHGSDWDAPGYITRAQWGQEDFAFKQAFIDNDFQILGINDFPEDDGGERRQFSERIDVGYAVSDNVKILAWGFGLQSKWVRYAKFFGSSQSESNYRIGKYGAGANVNFDIQLYREIKIIGTAGYEFFRDGTKYKRYDSEYRRRTGLSQWKETEFDNHAFFIEMELFLHRFFRPTLAARYDMFAGNYTDKLFTSILGTTISTVPLRYNQSFGVEKYDHISPKVGFRSTLVDDVLDIRASVCNGFILPPDTTLFEFYYNLKPSEIWQYEAGITVTWENYVTADAAGYMIDTTNEIKEYPTGSNFYRNLGQTRRWGIEAVLEVNPVKWITLKGHYAWSNSEIVKNVRDSAENAYIRGNRIANIPKHLAGAEIIGMTPIGLGASARFSYTGEQYTDDLNTSQKKYRGYRLLDLALFYTLRVKDTYPLELGFTVKNVLNEHYATYASGDNFWSTGMPRSYYGTVSMRW